MDLANAIAAACEQPTNFQFLYPLDLSIKVLCFALFAAPAIMIVGEDVVSDCALSFQGIGHSICQVLQQELCSIKIQSLRGGKSAPWILICVIHPVASQACLHCPAVLSPLV